MADVDIDLYGDVEQDFTQDREMSWTTLPMETCMTQSSRGEDETGNERPRQALPNLPQSGMGARRHNASPPHSPSAAAPCPQRSGLCSRAQWLTPDASTNSISAI